MTRKFDEMVRKVADRIVDGRVVLTERVRQGRRRNISVGPYRTATSSKRQYAMCTLPALPDADDCQISLNPNRAAKQFVRLVGTDNAQNALVRESQKRQGK